MTEVEGRRFVFGSAVELVDAVKPPKGVLFLEGEGVTDVTKEGPVTFEMEVPLPEIETWGGRPNGWEALLSDELLN